MIWRTGNRRLARRLKLDQHEHGYACAGERPIHLGALELYWQRSESLCATIRQSPRRGLGANRGRDMARP